MYTLMMSSHFSRHFFLSFFSKTAADMFPDFNSMNFNCNNMTACSFLYTSTKISLIFVFNHVNKNKLNVK